MICAGLDSLEFVDRPPHRLQLPVRVDVKSCDLFPFGQLVRVRGQRNRLDFERIRLKDGQIACRVRENGAGNLDLGSIGQDRAGLGRLLDRLVSRSN